MNPSELQSFVSKFRSLWQTSLDAHLKLKSHAGKAWVSLAVQLGDAPGPLQPPPHIPPLRKKNRNGPSQQRRRERRAAARAEKEKADKAVENLEAEKAEAEKIETEFSDVNAEEVINFSENIPQLDGESNTNDPTFCPICKNSDELESAEDLDYHLMNDHDPQKVFAIYGKEWIENRRKCIRKWSPFERWFSTPFI